MFEKKSICFLADRHALYDDRIYWKMAVPLEKLGFKVHYLLVGDRNEKGRTQEGIYFQMFKLKVFSENRVLNFVLKRLNPNNNYKKMLDAAKELKSDIYHFHDLWINRIAPTLKRLDHKPVVFYDAREPYAEDYLSYVKTSFPFFLRLFASRLDSWEKRRAKYYDLVIANESIVQGNFARAIGEEKSVVLYNYSDLSLDTKAIPMDRKKYDLIYCGAITELRGVYEMIEAIKKVKEELPEVKALFIGNYYPLSLKDTLQKRLQEYDLINQIELHDPVPYKEISHYYNLSRVGLVLLKKVKTYEISMPIKLFEYMTFGLPVIGSDFGHIKDFINMDSCGIAVSPENSEAVADAILTLLKNPVIYQKYSDNGRNAALNKYSWDREFEKLVAYYKKYLHER